MAKAKHSRRSRPRPLPARRHRTITKLDDERRTRRELDRWRRSGAA